MKKNYSTFWNCATLRSDAHEDEQSIFVMVQTTYQGTEAILLNIILKEPQLIPLVINVPENLWTMLVV